MSGGTEQRDAILLGQRDALALIARGSTLREVLTSVARYSEESTPHMLASILFYEPETGRLRRGGHHRLPDAFADAVDGLEPGPSAGSCGTAAFRRARVVSHDVREDPLWEAFREFAAQYGIRSAWSTPLMSPSDGSLLGVFGMYYPDARTPSEEDLGVVDHFAHLAAIAIERHRRDAALRESERLRQQHLLATASGLAHELNTPLGVALTAQSLLDESLETLEAKPAETGASLARLRNASKMIRANLERAAQHVRTFRASVLEPSVDRSVDLDLGELVRNVVESLTPLLDERRIRVELRTPQEPLQAFGSPMRFAEVVSNLVTNAAMHAYDHPTGGPLRVVVEPSVARPGWAELVVQDTGRGMDAELRQRCTEPFFTTRRSSGGTGLGLFLVKHAVESELRGQLLLDTSPKAGVSWRVQLPPAGWVGDAPPGVA